MRVTPLGGKRRERKRAVLKLVDPFGVIHVTTWPTSALKAVAIDECRRCYPKSRIVLPIGDDGVARCEHREADRIARKAADA